MASRPEGGHYVGDNDIKCLIISGIHEEVCGAAMGPQELSPHTITSSITK